MAKLVIVFDDTQSKEGNHLTNYLKLISDLTISENCKKCYQGVQLKHFTRVLQTSVLISRKGLVTSKIQQSSKTLKTY